MSDYDSPWKEVLDRYFERFMLFFFPQVHADIDWSRGYETLDKELQKIAPAAEQGRRFVDKLVKVWLVSGEESWLLIHVEVQTGRESGFARRMYVYNNRIFARYDHEVISLAILADDNLDWRPTQYSYGRWGFRSSTEFPIVKLLDYAPHWQMLETNENPFAIVVLTHLKALETREHPIDRQAWKLRLVKGLYERGWSAEDVRQLFLFIDWVMDLPSGLAEIFEQEMQRYEEEKRMPFIPSFERRALSEGLLEGIDLALDAKFGDEGLRLMPQIEQLTDPDSLHAVINTIKAATTLDELRAGLRALVPEKKEHAVLMTTFERRARIEELVAGIELGLDLKFGAAGLRLLTEIKEIKDVEKLQAIRAAIKGASTPEELRRMWAP